MKADDGGLGISYDRGDHFLYVTSLALSQYYRISVDLAHPYNVYGGLQDNGSWAGPSQVYRSEGILNEDWVRWGGGDGFLSLVDTTENRILYAESQYLGLTRTDMTTGQTRNIRPAQPEGFISDRRNWTTWPMLDGPEQRLGNAMAPGNWDGPFILSPHDNNTLYAGLDNLYKSTDRGDTWADLGDLTTGIDRRRLEIMDQRADSFVLSLDDGIPYWPTITTIAESEFTAGVLFVGSDDGQVSVSMDDGRTWTDVTDDVPGFPDMGWVNGLHPSKHAEGRVFLVANNYRNDDYGNYLWRSDDDGLSWRSIVGDLPGERVARTLREDPRNPDVLWLGTELGVFWSWNGGTNWVELRGGLPTVAVNDLVIHPRDNDLVMGTHGRGVWILDQVNALQELTPEVTQKPAHIFSLQDAEQIRYRRERAHAGNMIFRGENPPAGAIIDYWLRPSGGDVSVTVHDATGAQVATVQASTDQGMNRVVWDLRHGESSAPGEGGGGGRFGQPARGPFVVPGLYTVRLTAEGESMNQVVRVREDPRLQVDPLVRRQWTATLLRIGEMASRGEAVESRVGEVISRLDEGELELPGELEAKVRDLARELRELTSRSTRLRGSVESWVGPLSADQASQEAFLSDMLDALAGEWEQIRGQAGGE